MENQGTSRFWSGVTEPRAADGALNEVPASGRLGTVAWKPRPGSPAVPQDGSIQPLSASLEHEIEHVAIG